MKLHTFGPIFVFIFVRKRVTEAGVLIQKSGIERLFPFFGIQPRDFSGKYNASGCLELIFRRGTARKGKNGSSRDPIRFSLNPNRENAFRFPISRSFYAFPFKKESVNFAFLSRE